MKANNKSKVEAKALLSKADMEAISDLMGGLMDKQAAILASKQDLKDEIGASEGRIKSELKEYMHEGFEAVMDGVDAISEKLAEKEKVELLMSWAKEVGKKVGIKISL